MGEGAREAGAGVGVRAIVGAMLDNEAHCLACGDAVMADERTRAMILLHEEHRLLTCVRCQKTLDAANAQAKPS